ncbi:MAG: DNA/RNA non-specific endonuclease [Candidatus Saccharibacteria bacterium]|nr:DNA/RNA non-specific endonuclease [Candidatus Saccharibacteria bacterium]
MVRNQGSNVIASQFEGPGEAINIVAMDRTLNGSSGEWYKMEQKRAKYLKEGKKVEVKIEVLYKNSKDKRPSEFKISYKVDGVKIKPIKLKNTATGK